MPERHPRLGTIPGHLRTAVMVGLQFFSILSYLFRSFGKNIGVTRL